MPGPPTRCLLPAGSVPQLPRQHPAESSGCRQRLATVFPSGWTQTSALPSCVSFTSSLVSLCVRDKISTPS